MYRTYWKSYFDHNLIYVLILVSTYYLKLHVGKNKSWQWRVTISKFWVNLEVRGEDDSSVMTNKKIQLVDERFGGQGIMFQRW